MMGIKEYSDMSKKEKKSEKKKYIVVKNHVREISSIKATQKTSESNDEENKEVQEDRTDNVPTSSSDVESSVSAAYVKDLEELRTFYFKCKYIMRKMERKYGHILQLGDREGSNARKRRLSSEECQCTLRRKIVYDDDGREIHQNVDEDHHICHKNIQKSYSNPRTTETVDVNIENENDNELPDDINELTKMSKDPNINKYTQHKVIQKIKNIHNEKINLLRYEKPTIIEKVKLNCDEIFEFGGSNLSSLPGYPIK